jgi:predicted PurR-regulated permease PerM
VRYFIIIIIIIICFLFVVIFLVLVKNSANDRRCSIDQAIEEIRELLNEVHSVLSKGNSSLSPYSIVSLASIIKDIKKVRTRHEPTRTHNRTRTPPHLT